jgi:hypothetical protein
VKKPGRKTRRKAQTFSFENNKVDFSKFKSDPSTSDIARLTAGIKVWPWVIEVLSPTKTIGRGRTNLTLLLPLGGELHTDATVPYAGIYGEPGTVTVHFEPIAYGITSVATYIMVFNIQTIGSTTFFLGGDVGTGTLPNAGNKTVNGSVSLGLIMQNVQPSQQTYGVLHQVSGPGWRWYSTVIQFPIVAYP